MRKNHFIKIFVTYMLIILIGTMITGYLSIELLKGIFVSSVETRMRSNINLIKTSISEQLQRREMVDFDYLAKVYSEDIGSTVTFIGEDGNVIGERIKGFNNGKNFLKNNEIINAKDSGFGDTLDYNEDAKINILATAEHFKSDKFSGYIHLSTPLREVSDIYRGLLSYALIGVVFILLSSGILRFLFLKDIVNPLKLIAENSKTVGKDETLCRVNIDSDDTIGVLAEEYNTMLDRLENKISGLVSKSHQIEAGLKSVSIGMLVADSESKILYTNPSLLELFGSEYDTEAVKGHKVVEVIRDTKIYGLTKEVFEHETQCEIETVLDDNSQRIVKVSISPVSYGEGISYGCFVSIYDITKLKKLEQMGSDFVSNATHELKTPLTSIKGFVETLQGGAVEDRETAYKFLEIINQECDRLHSLINDILQLSELQNVNQDVNLGLHGFQDIIPEVIVFLENQAKNKQVDLVYKVDEDLPLVRVNKDRIKQMLINLVENAVKYSQSGSKVEVKAFVEEGSIVLTVEDNGIGIPEASIPRLFERFYRVDKGRSRSQGGTGLGLSIVKHIVDLYRGSIDVKSEVGKGTQFTIKLPTKVA